MAPTPSAAAGHHLFPPAQAHSMSNQLASSLAGLEEVERHLSHLTALPGADATTSSYASYLRDARDVFRHQVSNNIRLSALLKVGMVRWLWTSVYT